MADENKIPLSVEAFLEALRSSERHPCRAVYHGLTSDRDPTPYILPRDRESYSSKFLRAVNRVIIDPCQESVPGGRLLKGFHANWVMARNFHVNPSKVISLYGIVKTAHFRLCVDGCRFRYYRCTSCGDAFGVGREIVGNELDSLRTAIYATFAWDYLSLAVGCVSAVLSNDAAGVFVRNILPWEITGGVSLAVINHTLMSDAIYDYITMYLELVKKVRPRVFLQGLNNPGGRTAVVRSLQIERDLEEMKLSNAQLAAIGIPLRESDIQALPYDLKLAFQWSEAWYYIVYWEDPDISPTRVPGGSFAHNAGVWSTDGQQLGLVVVRDILAGITKPRELRHPHTFSRFVEHQIARQDAEEEKESTKRLQAKARAALEQQRQEDAMYQSDSFVAMQLESTDEEGDE